MVLVRFFTGQLATAHVLLFLEYESELESLATSLRLKWSEKKFKKNPENMFVNFVTLLTLYWPLLTLPWIEFSTFCQRQYCVILKRLLSLIDSQYHYTLS